MLFSPFRRHRRLLGFLPGLTGILALTLTPVCLSAKSVTIADTGYQLEVPGNFNVHRPAGAPDILLQADRPDGNGTIQVVRRPGHGSATDFIAGYEAQMLQALGNLNLQQENMRTIAGRSCTFRRYQSFADGMQIRVQAVFYADGQQGFIIHAIDTAAGAPEFERALVSLQAPGGASAATPSLAQTGWGPAASTTSPLPSGRQDIGETAFSFLPPAGWQSTQASQSPGLGYALPEKGAAMELTWLDVSGQVGDRANFLDQTVAQIANNFGEGWHERERSPHRNGDTNVLFTRFGGQLGSQTAELMILGVTDGKSLVLAYGYFAELGRDSAGPAMREAILSIKSKSSTNSTAVTNTAPVMPRMPSNPVRLPAAPTADTRPAAGYRSLVVDDAGLEFAFPSNYELAQRSEGQSQWADPNAPSPKIVLVNQSIMRSAGQTVDSVRDDLLAQVHGSSAAELIATGSTTINGLKAHTLHFTLNRGAEPQHFRFVVLDLPGPVVATVSFTAPESQNQLAERHFNEVLRTAHATTVVERPGTATAVPTPPPARNHRTEPATSEDAYFALADAVAAADWDWVIVHLTDKAIQNFCRSFRDEIPDADLTEADALDDPAGTMREYLNYRVPKETLAGYFQSDRTITGVREENADWHLVMTKKASGGEHYIWFKRIKGIWRFDY